MPNKLTRRGKVTTPEGGDLVIATDAAVSLSRTLCGTAHLGTEGSWGLTLRPFDGTEGDDPVVVCELRAVYYALRHIDASTGALVLTDSQSALGWLQRWRDGDDAYPSGYNSTQRWPGVSHLARLRTTVIQNKDLLFTWVPAHVGHPLNEFTDSAAKLALRIGLGEASWESAKTSPPAWAALRLADFRNPLAA